jgi:hypothetical protein
VVGIDGHAINRLRLELVGQAPIEAQQQWLLASGQRSLTESQRYLGLARSGRADDPQPVRYKLKTLYDLGKPVEQAPVDRLPGSCPIRPCR